MKIHFKEVSSELYEGYNDNDEQVCYIQRIDHMWHLSIDGKFVNTSMFRNDLKDIAKTIFQDK